MSPSPRRRRNRAVALGAAGIGAGLATVAAYNSARRHRADVLDMSELAMPDDLEAVAVTVDDGVTIHGVAAGEGRPIVLLHGVTLSVATWPYQFAALAKEFRVYAFDARGHGRSVCDLGGWGIDRMANDVAQVFAELDLRGAVVVGHSMGGMVTQQLCVDFPDVARERVAGTILLSTAAAPGAPFADLTRGAVPPRALSVRRFTRSNRIIPGGEVGYALARVALGAKADPRFVAHTRDMTGSVAASTVDAVLSNVIGFDLRARLADYPVPALVITGSRDLLTPPRVGRELARCIPGATFEVVPGGGHMLMLERAEWLNERIAKFSVDH
jgi:pimeloyl-ACP methyl ester carboxylesterase